MSGSPHVPLDPQVGPAQEDLYRILVSGVREYAIYLLDPAGQVLTWNAGAERLKGYAEHEILGQHFGRFFTPDDQAAGVPQRILQAAHRTGTHREQGWRVRKDGTRFWADVLITAIYTPEGTLKGFAKVTRDETEAHAMQEQLRASEERFRLLVSGLREHALYMLDPEGRVASWNEGAQRIKQYTADEIIGRHFSVFFTPDDRAANKPQRELEIARNLGLYEEEGWRQRKDGTRFWAAVVVTALRDASGTIRGFAKVTRDETRRHQTSVELQQALDRATAAERQLREHAATLELRVAERTRQLSEQAEHLRALNRELEQFAYIASHDLQEPLRMVTMHLDLLLHRSSKRLDPRSMDTVHAALEGAERMRQLIHSLLAYARIEHAPRTFGPVDAHRAFSEAVQHLKPMIEERHAHVEATPLPTLPMDYTQLVLVFQNLIGNAIKFNRSVQPTVQVTAHRDGDHWSIAVRDNGIGIDPAHLDQIFQPFRRLHDAQTFPGSGIGLASVKKIVERHGGRVHASSAGTGHGTTITLTLRPS